MHHSIEQTNVELCFLLLCSITFNRSTRLLISIGMSFFYDLRVNMSVLNTLRQKFTWLHVCIHCQQSMKYTTPCCLGKELLDEHEMIRTLEIFPDYASQPALADNKCLYNLQIPKMRVYFHIICCAIHCNVLFQWLLCQQDTFHSIFYFHSLWFNEVKIVVEMLFNL